MSFLLHRSGQHPSFVVLFYKARLCNDNKDEDFTDVGCVAVLNYTLTKDSHE